MKAELNDEERDQIYNLLKEYVNANWSKDRRLIRSRLHVFIQSAMQRAVEEVEKPLVIKDREQLIYDLRRFADQSFYISEISKIGANEIINFLIDQIKAQVQSELTTLRAEVERLKQCEAIVREIAEDDNWLSGNPKCRQWVKDNPE